MKTEDFKIRLEELKKIKQDNLEKFINPLTKEILELKDKMYKNIVLNKEYITDLSEFEGKEISFIALDSIGEEVYLPTDEIIEVKNGKLYLSSFCGGIVYFDTEKNNYVHCYHCSEKTLDISGFIDVKIKE